MLTLNSKNIIKARKMLFIITDFMDLHGVKYFLEGGTLLGVVRDGDLLPWDHDVDISITQEDAINFDKLRWKLLLKGYWVTRRKTHKNFGPFVPNDYRVFKMKPLAPYLLKIIYPKVAERMLVVDVFVKKDDEHHTYWQAMEKLLRVDKTHYDSQDFIQFMGRNLSVPHNYKDYLSKKYGDWTIPVREWSCKDDEKTIID